MVPSPPRITLVTPSLNQAQFLEDTIRSVVFQHYPNLEYFVLDGGSTDGSIDIIRKYEQQLTYWRSCRDGGQAAAINEGFERATGEILGWVNSDDMLIPNSLFAVARAFAKYPRTEMIVGKSIIIDEDNKVTRPVCGLRPTYHSVLFWSTGAFTQPATFWRRSVMEQVGPLRPEFRLAFDCEFYLRLLRIGRSKWINDYLAAFRIHPDSITSTLKAERDREAMEFRYRLYGLGSWPAAFRSCAWMYYQARCRFFSGLFKLAVLTGLERVPIIES